MIQVLLKRFEPLSELKKKCFRKKTTKFSAIKIFHFLQIFRYDTGKFSMNSIHNSGLIFKKTYKGDRMKFSTVIRCLLLVILISGCASKPPVEYPDLPKGYAMEPREDGGFTEIISFLHQSYGDNQSGFLLLDSNEEGLHWRLALIDKAKHTLDLQYYLWYPEDSARLILKRLFDAADRGVKVRLIVDDLLIIDMDKGVAALDDHPNIEVRLFNPFEERESMVGRGMEGLERLEKLNVRMHNKLMVADNQAAILGGRNIGNHYFGLSDDYNFHDLDVLGFGEIAHQSSTIFDHFWNSDWVQVPFALGEQPTKKQVEKAVKKLYKKVEKSDRLDRFLTEPQDWTERFSKLQEQLAPGISTVIFDKVDDEEDVSQEMRDPITKLFRAANEEILLVNAYIIPSKESSMENLKKLIDKGVKIRVLTNSLESNDVAAVNSHYEEWRKPMLKTGAELYEMRADGQIQSLVVDTPPVKGKFMGLHSKAMVVDRKLVFIGSMNFDPRSININTEMGVVLYSPQLGEELALLIERDMEPENSWQVLLDEDGDEYWKSSKGIETSQPVRGFGQRIENIFFKMFPKEYY